MGMKVKEAHHANHRKLAKRGSDVANKDQQQVREVPERLASQAEGRLREMEGNHHSSPCAQQATQGTGHERAGLYLSPWISRAKTSSFFFLILFHLYHSPWICRAWMVILIPQLEANQIQLHLAGDPNEPHRTGACNPFWRWPLVPTQQVC